MKYDALVVGAGPAGATTAYHLAKAGLKVLLLEKRELPRFKLCAGCLSLRTLGLLPDGYESLLLNRIKVGKIAFRGGRECRLESREPVAFIVDRSSFDYFLVEKALQAGAKLTIEDFQSFVKEGSHYRVYTSGGTYTADLIVGADGFHSKTARLLGYRKKKFFRSLEIFTEGGLEDEVLIELGWVSRGYLWLFPHGEGLSLGVATTGGENLIEILRSYCRLKDLTYKNPLGWHIPYSEHEDDFQLGRERVLLVGDAACMADPLIGEGIYYSIWAGGLLAKAVEENPSAPLIPYNRLLKPLMKELIYAGKIARLAYRFQRIAMTMGKKGALENMFSFLRGEKNYTNLYRRGIFSFLKSLTIDSVSTIFKADEGRNSECIG